MNFYLLTKLFGLHVILVLAHYKFDIYNTYSNVMKYVEGIILITFIMMLMWALYNTMYPPRQSELRPSDDSGEENRGNLNNNNENLQASSDSDSDNPSSESDSGDELRIEFMSAKRRQPNNGERGLRLDNSLPKNGLIRQFDNSSGYNFTGNDLAGFRKFCAFCQENGEPEFKYRNHNLKDRYSRCTCPILQLFVCPICKATGSQAHTAQYCPYHNNDCHKFKFQTKFQKNFPFRKVLNCAE